MPTLLGILDPGVASDHLSASVAPCPTRVRRAVGEGASIAGNQCILRKAVAFHFHGDSSSRLGHFLPEWKDQPLPCALWGPAQGSTHRLNFNPEQSGFSPVLARLVLPPPPPRGGDSGSVCAHLCPCGPCGSLGGAGTGSLPVPSHTPRCVASSRPSSTDPPPL